MDFLKIRNAVLITTVFLISSLFCISDIQAISASDISAKPALEGNFIKGKMLPLKVVIDNPDGKPVEGELKITGGLMEYETQVHVEPYSAYKKWILAYPHAGSDLILQFTAEDGSVFNKDILTSQFISRKKLVLYISKEKGRLSSFDSAFNSEYTFSAVTPRELWDIWEGYGMANYVLLDADTVEIMPESQLTALKKYVLSGGSLYISGSRHPEIYRQNFFQGILSTRSLGHISLLSFDPADRDFQLSIPSQGGVWKSIDGQNRAMHIPAENSAEEAGKLFNNVVKWNTGYLVLLALTGLAWNKRYRSFLWPVLIFLVITASLSSMGIINGNDRIRGISVINISSDDEIFLQSRIDVMSVRNTGLSADFQGGFIYPAEIDKGADRVIVYEEDLKKTINAALTMLGHKDLIWERFEKMKKPLNVNLKVYPESVQGEIENLSEYLMDNTHIWMNGRFYPLPSIEAGHKISVNIIYGKDNYLPYPEGRQWISRYIQNNDDGMESQGIKITGLWKKPILKFNENGSSVDKEETFLIYHL